MLFAIVISGEVPKFTIPKNPQEENINNNNNYHAATTNNIPMLGHCKQAIYHPVGETDSEAVFCASECCDAMSATISCDVYLSI